MVIVVRPASVAGSPLWTCAVSNTIVVPASPRTCAGGARLQLPRDSASAKRASTVGARADAPVVEQHRERPAGVRHVADVHEGLDAALERTTRQPPEACPAPSVAVIASEEHAVSSAARSERAGRRPPGNKRSACSPPEEQLTVKRAVVAASRPRRSVLGCGGSRVSGRPGWSVPADGKDQERQLNVSSCRRTPRPRPSPPPPGRSPRSEKATASAGRGSDRLLAAPATASSQCSTTAARERTDVALVEQVVSYHVLIAQRPLRPSAVEEIALSNERVSLTNRSRDGPARSPGVDLPSTLARSGENRGERS